jgi:cytochrome P450
MNTVMNNTRRIEDFTDDFDPFGALLTIGGEGHITEPLLELGRLRRQSPVVEGDLHMHFGAPRQLSLGDVGKAFMVLGFKQCNELLLDHQHYSNHAYESSVGITFGKSITTMDPPHHLKYRRLFQSAFTPKMLNTLKPRFQQVIDRVVGRFEGRGHANLVDDLARHFPFQFICDLMDLPPEDRPTFHKLAAAQTCVMFDRAHGVEASEKLGRYLSSLIIERRALQSDTDFISILTNAEIDGERLPEDVLLGFFRQLMNAGGDTSYHGFSNILAALFTNPEQLEAIRKDRALIPQAIEEGLRWGAPITSMDRLTTADVELAGVPLPRNSLIRVCIAAANRDDAVWPDPDKFDIFREQKRALPFGYGAHVCIGQHLARMELQTSLNVLLDRLPNLRLDPDKPSPVIHGLTFRGANAVHVKWD